MTFKVLKGRPASVGGEALILPLIVLLFCFGYKRSGHSAPMKKAITTVSRMDSDKTGL